jgi:hypothetical protein
VDRSNGFVNLNRYKSGRAIKRFQKNADRYPLKKEKKGKP